MKRATLLWAEIDAALGLDPEEPEPERPRAMPRHRARLIGHGPRRRKVIRRPRCLRR